ncbi:MAG: tRNA (N(6)-L-threonylcarbamoyladenosine(37)-C(2))-methylthiotransferase [Candidatus Aenigmarchaeota archaeon]|nr:tRNA (N(6)-L-threonylcarbamoyladenosine(37)-C(2))-methylthiotransferase [Candidatus Aenigmarchaeota archaeon]
MKPRMSVYIETYGCTASQARSEIMEGALAANQMAMVKHPARADVILLNTCIVKTPTENRIRDRIKSLVKKYPHKTLVIAGCATDVGFFRNIAPNALFLSSHKPEEVTKLLLKKTNEKTGKMRKNPLVGITEISSGCLGKCSYCIVRLARGELKSKSPDEIIAEVERALADGCMEIWLTSQDNSCYGFDIESNLAGLLEKIAKLDGKFRIRVGMMNPSHAKPILKRLLKAYASKKVYKFVHIPVQSGSDKILKSMGRGYSAGEFEKLVDAFRHAFPLVTLSTDVIVGFPGETGGNFEKTLKLIERIKPDIVNVSKFGARPGTIAARMRQLDNRIIKERSAAMASLVRRIGAEANKKWLGRTCEIFVTEKGRDKKQFTGRNESYKPVIVEGKRLLGKVLKVKITKCGQTFLAAKINQS